MSSLGDVLAAGALLFVAWVVLMLLSEHFAEARWARRRASRRSRGGDRG